MAMLIYLLAVRSDSCAGLLAAVRLPVDEGLSGSVATTVPELRSVGVAEPL